MYPGIEDCLLSADTVRVMRGKTLIVVLTVLAAACSGSDSSTSSTFVSPSVDSTNAAAATPRTSAAAPTTTTVVSASTSLDPDEIEVSDEVLDYLTAVEELLAGTAYEDAASEDADVFIATGFLFCEQLTEGEQPADVLTTYVEALTGSDIEVANDGDLTLAGSILGTAVGYLCPEHTELIEKGL